MIEVENVYICLRSVLMYNYDDFITQIKDELINGAKPKSDEFINLIYTENTRDIKETKDRKMSKKAHTFYKQFREDVSQIFPLKGEDVDGVFGVDILDLLLYSPHYFIDKLYDYVEKYNFTDLDKVQKVYQDILIGFEFLFHETRDKYRADGIYSFRQKFLYASEKSKASKHNYGKYIDLALALGLTNHRSEENNSDAVVYTIKRDENKNFSDNLTNKKYEIVYEHYKCLSEIKSQPIKHIQESFREVINQFNKDAKYGAGQDTTEAEKQRLYQNLCDKFFEGNQTDYYLKKGSDNKYIVNNNFVSQIDWSQKKCIHDIKTVRDIISTIASVFVSKMDYQMRSIKGFQEPDVNQTPKYSDEQLNCVFLKKPQITIDFDYINKIKAEQLLNSMLSALEKIEVDSKIDILLYGKTENCDNLKQNEDKLKNIIENYYEDKYKQNNKSKKISINDKFITNLYKFVLNDNIFDSVLEHINVDKTKSRIVLAPIIVYSMVTSKTDIRKMSVEYGWSKEEIVHDLNFVNDDDRTKRRKIGFYIRLRELFSKQLSNAQKQYLVKIWDDIFVVLTGYSYSDMVFVDVNQNDYDGDIFALDYIKKKWTDDIDFELITMHKVHNLDEEYENIKGSYKRSKREVKEFFIQICDEFAHAYREKRYFILDEDDHRAFINDIANRYLIPYECANKFKDRHICKCINESLSENIANLDSCKFANSCKYLDGFKRIKQYRKYRKLLKKHEYVSKSKPWIRMKADDIIKLSIEECLKDINVEQSKKKLKEIGEKLRTRA